MKGRENNHPAVKVCMVNLSAGSYIIVHQYTSSIMLLSKMRRKVHILHVLQAEIQRKSLPIQVHLR